MSKGGERMSGIEDIDETRELLGNLLSKRFFSHITSLALEVGTNVPQGGDAGHGGRTLLGLEDVKGNAWDLYVETESGELLKFEYPRKVDIVLYGDSEGLTFIRGTYGLPRY
ncbi:MAG: hypothetical protein J7L91_03495 [Candidatus Korarchaeota archaeon]|nr:hypothetical protein [Candidatus Korarchaeota archaeon]